jgi:hypothetical protein
MYSELRSSKMLRRMPKLRLGFALTKISGREAPVLSDVESKVAEADRSKLTIRAALHYLWEQAGLNKWSPKVSGGTQWETVRILISQAAARAECKGQSLSRFLYIPCELRNPRSEDEQMRAQQALRQHFYQMTAGQDAKKRNLILMLGELGRFADAPYGTYLFPKHGPHPRIGIMADAEMMKRIQKRFKTELQFDEAYKAVGVRVMMICTCSVDETHTARLNELSLVTTTQSYIPLDTIEEMELIEAMMRHGRSFYKGLRYNVPLTKPMAALTAVDTGESATAMYISAPNATDDYKALLANMISDSTQKSWVWQPSEGAMPDLPSAHVGSLMQPAGTCVVRL